MSCRCLLCWSLEINLSRPPKEEEENDLNNPTSTATWLIEEGAKTIFLLRKLLRLSSSECQELLQRHGHPAEWVALCSSCTTLVQQGQNLWLEMGRLQQEFNLLGSRVRDQIRVKQEIFEEDEEDTVNYEEGRPYLYDSTTFAATEEIRSKVLSSSDGTGLDSEDFVGEFGQECNYDDYEMEEDFDGGEIVPDCLLDEEGNGDNQIQEEAANRRSRRLKKPNKIRTQPEKVKVEKTRNIIPNKPKKKKRRLKYMEINDFHVSALVKVLEEAGVQNPRKGCKVRGRKQIDYFKSRIRFEAYRRKLKDEPLLDLKTIFNQIKNLVDAHAAAGNRPKEKKNKPDGNHVSPQQELEEESGDSKESSSSSDEEELGRHDPEWQEEDEGEGHYRPATRISWLTILDLQKTKLAEINDALTLIDSSNEPTTSTNQGSDEKSLELKEQLNLWTSLRQLSRHYYVYSFPCPNCDKCLDSFSSWSKHHAWCSGTKIGFKCQAEGCEHSYRSNISLELHVLVKHLATSAMTCVGCGTLFKLRTDFHKHITSAKQQAADGDGVSGECLKNAVYCTNKFCCNPFPTSEALKVHQEIRHPKVIPTPFNCQQCSSKFFTLRSLKVHVKINHDETLDPNSFVCEQCGKGYPLKDRLTAHIAIKHKRVRKQEPKVACEICGRPVLPCNLDEHVLTHKPVEEREFLCTECGKRCQSKTCLSNHMLTHDPEKYVKYSNYKKIKNKGAKALTSSSGIMQQSGGKKRIWKKKGRKWPIGVVENIR